MCLIINLVEHSSVVHLPLGVTAHRLAFELELNDRDSLMHLCHQLGRTRQTRVVLKVLGLPYRTGVVAVHGHREVSERQEVDAVSFLERLDVRIANAHA